MQVLSTQSSESIWSDPYQDRVERRRRGLLTEIDLKISTTYQSYKREENNYNLLHKRLASKWCEGRFSKDGKTIRLEIAKAAKTVRNLREAHASLKQEKQWIIEGRDIRLLDPEDAQGKSRILKKISNIKMQMQKENQEKLKALQMQLANKRCLLFSKAPASLKLQIQDLEAKIAWSETNQTIAKE